MLELVALFFATEKVYHIVIDLVITVQTKIIDG